ncbi:glycosyltransferase [Rubrolithibacter danxiaensis]|uniref:glycosyltransferase n=1 Tax=Rubrolithibacter danxiaensis TaxID=3390805 RepID=UPI003BF824C3
MRKKVFFIISSLNAGGAEKVFWLLSQYFDKSLYEVNIVLLNGKKIFFSQSLEDINLIDLGTKKASLSFFKLYSLLKKEKPHAIFTTGGQINALMGFTSFFIKVPNLIARPANVADLSLTSIKAKLLSYFLKISYNRFHTIICQSKEIKDSLLKTYSMSPQKMVIIPNPVLPSGNEKNCKNKSEKRIVMVGRLAKQKGHERFLDIFKQLPDNYKLTIAGDGPLRSVIEEKIKNLQISSRVTMLGLVSGVTNIVAKHEVFALPSFFEGFPNAVVESLSVGTPVVAFNVGGITEIIKNDFNGYIIQQNDLEAFKAAIVKALNKEWDYSAIQKDVSERFSVRTIVDNYQKLIA